MIQEQQCQEVKMVKVQASPQHNYYLDGIKKDNLDYLKHEVLKKDWDGFIVYDGLEGSGKSTMAFQDAMYLDSTFNLDRVVFTIEQFVEASEKAERGQAIVFDETMGYLGSRGAMSKFNRMLIKIFSEMRSKNLFILLCIPSFFELDKYPAIHRSVALFHIHKRGHFCCYNHTKKKLLYIYGKKYYSYSKPTADFVGRFVKYFPLDKEAYERKKQEGIKLFQDAKEREKNLQKQRDVLIKYCFDNKLMGLKPLSETVGLSEMQIRRILT